MTAITAQFGHILLELTPLQRWDAITSPQTNPANGRWFALIGLLLVVILTALLIAINRRRKESEKPSPQLFDDYARVRDLTDREYRILLTIATNADLKRPELIFKLPSTFDRESARLLESVRVEQGIEPCQQLQAELTLVRQKLGFRQLTTAHHIAAPEPGGQSTLQIPVNKKLFIKSGTRQKGFDLEATVIKNTSSGLTVQLKIPVEIVFGQSWMCRYYAGAFVAEFDTTVVKCSNQFVLLAHSHQVRLINRRRFQRVPIQKQAYVAVFPFKRIPYDGEQLPRKKIRSVVKKPQPMDQIFELPQFMPATVTEIGGPGLKICTGLTLNVGDRVLILFKLDVNAKGGAVSDRNRSSEMIIEHIARVRHITNQEDGISVALEMIGLHDEGIDELIQATNRASVKMKKTQSVRPDTEDQAIWTEDLVSV